MQGKEPVGTLKKDFTFISLAIFRPTSLSIFFPFGVNTKVLKEIWKSVEICLACILLCLCNAS